MSDEIEVFNFDANGKKIDSKDLIIRDKIIYEIIKKYIKI